MTTSSISGSSSSNSSSGVGTFVSSTGSNSRIDGLISGLNTTAIINAIMQQAAQPQTNLKNQLTVEQAKLTAYQGINQQLAALQSAADAVTSPATWQAMTVASSSASVTASVSAGAQAGTFTFDVTQLASGQTSVSANTVSSTSTIVTTGSPVTLTVGSGSPVTINTGDGSLAAVAAGINSANLGVQASIVQVGTSSYRLQLTSTSTGANTAFTISGLNGGPLGSFNNTSTAQDAVITVGAGTPGQYTISSHTNTFNQVLPGLTFTVSQVTSGVSLTVTPDASGIADKIKAMVDAANAVLSSIGTATAYDPSNQQASVLTGDLTVNQIRNSILSAVSSIVGANQSATSVGLSVTKDGQITFDTNAFQAAYTANPAAAQSALGPGGSFAPAQSGLTGTVTLQHSSDATIPGSYDVTVTQAATKATGTIDTSSGLTAGQTITVSLGGTSVTYTVKAGDTVQTVVDGLNALAAQNSLGVSASVDPTNGSLIDLTANGYGSAYTFTSSATGGLVASAVTPGKDVAGTINGQTAQGVGQLLYTMPGTPGVDAITLTVTLTPADVAALGGGSAGTFTYTAGAAQALARVAETATDPVRGSLTSVINGENSTIADLNTQIANWQVVLDTKQAALEAQWASLESQLSALQAMSAQLGSAILSLQNQSSSRSGG